MKRVLLWYWGRRGGGAKYTLELARAMLERRDVEVHLSLSEQSELFQESSALGAPLHSVRTYADKVSAFVALFRLWSVRKNFCQYVEDRRIDVVVGTMSHLWNFLMLPTLRRMGVKYVFVVHDAVPHPGDRCFGIRQWMLKKEIACADRIIALTHHVRRQLQDTYRYPSELVTVIPHGVFVYNEVNEARVFPSDRPFRIAFFGRILPYKGLDLLLRAFRLLQFEFPQLELNIIGMGDISPYAALLGQLRNVVVENTWVGEEEVGAIFECADLMVASYIEASQSGMIPAAFSAALPVVVTPVGGLVEQVQHLETGYVAESVTAEAVAEGIRYFLKNPQMYVRCSGNALNHVKERLSWDAIAKQICDVVGEL